MEGEEKEEEEEECEEDSGRILMAIAEGKRPL
jgi:hypothetical protein